MHPWLAETKLLGKSRMSAWGQLKRSIFGTEDLSGKHREDSTTKCHCRTRPREACMVRRIIRSGCQGFDLDNSQAESIPAMGKEWISCCSASSEKEGMEGQRKELLAQGKLILKL